MSLKEKIAIYKQDPEKRIKLFTTITMVYNFFWAICKIIFGIISSAYLYCISGGYTLLIGFVKKTFLSNRNKSVNKNDKALVMGILLLLSGVGFGLYMGRLFIWPQELEYSLIWSISISACSFAEMGIAIYNIVKVKKKKDILLYSLRCCSLVSAVYAMVLTQVALLAATGAENVAYHNGATGIIAGVIAIIVGIVIIVKSKLKNKKETPHQIAKP